MKWMDMTLREYQSALASSSPTPGGGTASAVALGQAAALTVMVCDLTLSNVKWQDGHAIAEELQTIAIPIMLESGTLAQQDSEAFDQVMDAFSLPKSTDEERLVRKEQIRHSTLRAAEVPFETARQAASLLTHLPTLARLGNANAVTDVGVAGLLCSAAAKGAIFNVEINIQSLPEEWGKPMRDDLAGLKEQVRISSRSVMDAVRDRMGT